ncbi:Serine/threonine protein kinase [Handroanthus impetiginosus]|uniref:Serine/threonine protein kinase n=1 Tax=Handroanthus impetiginosus TaxID=429701 RepID=A0A2G9HU22_9LAMI|nr:Serine/threonine protein kinase [Handroanthus impetiginosus]
MLSRAFVKSKRSPQTGHESSLRLSSSIMEYEDLIFGFMEDIPLISFDEYNHDNYNCNNIKSMTSSESTQLTLRQVLRASVGVMGESPLGMTEKVVLLGGKICAVKRFRRVGIGRREFGRRIEKVAQIGNQCEYLVGVTAYLYAKRIKFVVCEYYPMGSLADLLSGAREQGHTALEWKHRFKIIQCIAKAIAFIHSQNPPRYKHLRLNVHGNIKSSNIMVNIDFSAQLSDYGFVQLAMFDDTGLAELLVPPLPEREYTKTVSQEDDIYNFGVVLMDILGWPEMKRSDSFEFSVEREEEEDVFKVLRMALSCRNSLPEERPTIEQILSCLGETVLKCVSVK